MAETSRTDVASRDVKYPTGAPEHTYAGADPERLSVPELPEPASPASNPALNRSAEALGRGVGTAVAGARRLPQQVNKLRSRIHLVPTRERAGETISDIRDSALETAADWRAAAEDSLTELKDRAEIDTHDVTERSNRWLEDLRRRARIAALRRNARHWLEVA